jgi:hypothetical protein
MTTALKAYMVHGDDEAVIMFSSNSATARREGANEMNMEWSDVDSCRRASEYDVYAPGPVPTSVMIETGWRFGCNCCGQWVTSDNPHPVIRGSIVYCDAACLAREEAEERAKAAAQNALLEAFYIRFPGAHAMHITVGDSLNTIRAGRGRHENRVSFTFPGGEHTVEWDFGDETCWLVKTDVPAWERWRSQLGGYA